MFGDFFGDQGRAVFVAMEQIVGVDEEAEDFDGPIELFQMGVAVGDVEAAREEVEAEGFDFFELKKLQLRHLVVWLFSQFLDLLLR